MSSNARCVQLSEELDENIKELQSMEGHHTESKAEIKKVMLLCSWRVGRALVESAVPVCVVPQQCTVSKAPNGTRVQEWCGGSDMLRGRSRSDKGAVERVGLQVSVRGCVASFVSIS